MTRLALSLLTCAILLLAACATRKVESPFGGWYSNYATCRAEYQAMDARVDAAGVREASLYRVPGFPYMRTDRFIASYRHDVKGMDDVSEWIRRMRELDQDARSFEYLNLGMSDFEAATQRDRFLNCGHVLAAIELENPDAWNRLVDAVQPPDEYSSLARVFGLYPLAKMGMQSRLDRMHQAALRAYAETEGEPDSGGVNALWRVKPAEDLDLLKEAQPGVIHNALGVPNLIGSAWRALAEVNAPQLLLNSAGAADGPAAPALGPNGPYAELARPEVNYQIGFTRYGGSTLVQISYFFWFKSPDAAPTGPIDGFIWRVTLDDQLNPLVYDSVRQSGVDHRWYPVQGRTLSPKPAAESGLEAAFIAPAPAPPHLPTLRLRAGSHDIRWVGAAPAVASGTAKPFELHPYDELFTLPRPAGGTRSLFGPDGLVAGAHGVDPIGGSASGIYKPGAPREYGHHAITHIGRLQFDDPHLLDLTFAPMPDHSGDIQARAGIQ